MTSMISKFKKFAGDESGATAIEYALIAVVLSVSIVGALRNMSSTLDATLTDAGNQVTQNAATSAN